MLINGKAIINPARAGFLIDNQLANAIVKADKITLKVKKSISGINQRNS